ncbi:hypothetical protein D3C71_1680120 [compost metagenome]
MAVQRVDRHHPAAQQGEEDQIEFRAVGQPHQRGVAGPQATGAEGGRQTGRQALQVGVAEPALSAEDRGGLRRSTPVAVDHVGQRVGGPIALGAVALREVGGPGGEGDTHDASSTGRSVLEGWADATPNRFSMVVSLAAVSSHSAAGSESATTPAPA